MFGKWVDKKRHQIFMIGVVRYRVVHSNTRFLSVDCPIVGVANSGNDEFMCSHTASS